MAPTRTKKQPSHDTAAAQKRPRDATPTTPERSPIKKRKMGITLQRKQTLIQNLQLEVTERARRLRAQYHMQAQGLRSRLEIRINRIPMALRKMKMQDLLQKCIEQEQARITAASRPPPVPAKDVPVRPANARQTTDTKRVLASARGQKRMSDELAGDKENDFEYADNAKKRVRAGGAPGATSVRPAQVLSPTSSNSRLANRDRPMSPVKGVARPGSPLKATATGRSAAASNLLSSMVEKAKGARPTTTRKVTATASTASAAPATAARGRKPAGAAASSRPPTRAGRRVSATSETSDGSTATTVVKKATGTRATGATSTTKKVMSTFRKGTASADTKKAAAKPAAATTTSGRILRKRG